MVGRRDVLKSVGLVAASGLLPSRAWAKSIAVPRLASKDRASATAVGKGLAKNGTAKFTELDALVTNVRTRTGDANTLELLFNVFREAALEQEKDKKYFLEKLAAHNAMGDAMSDYLHELTEATGTQGGGESKGEEHRTSPEAWYAYQVQHAAHSIRLIDKLDADAARVEREIAKLSPKAKGSPAVRALQEYLRKNRKLQAKARALYSDAHVRLKRKVAALAKARAAPKKDTRAPAGKKKK